MKDWIKKHRVSEIECIVPDLAGAVRRIATSLACGYIGMKKGLKPTRPLESSAYGEPAQLSRDWFRALERLSDSRPLRDVLGDAFVDVYVAVKEVEFDNFMNAISPWEREHLLLKV